MNPRILWLKEIREKYFSTCTAIVAELLQFLAVMNKLALELRVFLHEALNLFDHFFRCKRTRSELLILAAVKPSVVHKIGRIQATEINFKMSSLQIES